MVSFSPKLKGRSWERDWNVTLPAEFVFELGLTHWSQSSANRRVKSFGATQSKIFKCHSEVGTG